MNEKNIISSFFKRVILSMVVITIISIVGIYTYQKNTFYNSLAKEIITHIDNGLKKYDKIDIFNDKTVIEKDVKIFMRELGFISIEIYNENKNEVISFEAKGNRFKKKIELLKSHDNYVIHNFPNTKNMEHNFFEIPNGNYFLQIFYPIYKYNKIIGYIEGIKSIEPIIVNRFKRGLTIAIITVFFTIVLLSLTIFPIIYFSYKKLQENRIKLISNNILTINTLGNAIALRDSDTDEHNYRVSIYSIKLAQSLDLEKEQIKKLIIGSFLHDVGKIGITDNILLKNGKLTNEEFKLMKEHVNKGVELVKGNSWLEQGVDVIYSHHEKYDGTGYPNSLKKDEIPLIARVFSIADVFDALTSKRPYKEPFSYEKSIGIIEKDTNTHFDPYLVSNFKDISYKLYEEIKYKNKEELKEQLEKLINKYFLS